MSNPDTNPFASALSGFFFAGDKNDPRVNPQLRQKLALAMMAHGTKYPKNLGEGIAAVGENFADAIMQRRLEQADLAQQDQAAKLLGSPGAAPAQVSSLAPSDSVESQPQVIPPPAPPPATVPPQAPGRGFTPVAMQPGAGEMIDPGEYNALDAADPRNRYKPAPAYLQPALERNIADPERRGYLGQLAGKEAQRPGEVSSTGAAGPFQFTRGTGAQYGIPGNARFDPDASTLAANAFTDDNVKALTARLGREPAPGEMALAHQQGAGTAANMLTGAGNAPAQNLAVNNVSASLGPQAAAQKVMGYYGMPGAVGGGRDAVAAALMAQAQPQGRPSVADYGQPRALAATPPDSLPPEIATGASAISAAPPQPSGIRAAPPQQMAQAQPQAIPGYVPPPPGAPQAAPIVKPDPELLKLRALAATTAVQNNGYAQALLKARMDPLEAEHAIKQNAANEQYKAQIARDTEQIKMREQARVTQYDRQQQARKNEQGIIAPEAASAVDPRVLGTSQSPQRTGIPTPPPRPPDITPEKWAELQAPKLAAVNDAVDKATPALQESVRLINEARTHAGRAWGLGATGSFMRERAGTDAFAFGALNKQIMGKNFLAGYETLKGAGAIGEKEGAKGEQAQAQIDPNMAPKDYDAALLHLENTLKENLEIAQRKANRPVTAWQKTPNDEPAPDKGQIGLRKGKPSQYIGGNPALDSSYKDPT